MPERRETAVAHRNLKRRRVLKACCGVALCAPVVARGDETDDAAAPPQTDDALVFAYGKSSPQSTWRSAQNSCSRIRCT